MNHRGVYVASSRQDIDGLDLISGHILFMAYGRWSIETFRDCTYRGVLEMAELVIEDPSFYTLEQGYKGLREQGYVQPKDGSITPKASRLVTLRASNV